MLRGSICYAANDIYQQTNGVAMRLLTCMFMVETDTFVVLVLDNVLLK